MHDYLLNRDRTVTPVMLAKGAQTKLAGHGEIKGVIP